MEMIQRYERAVHEARSRLEEDCREGLRQLISWGAQGVSWFSTSAESGKAYVYLHGEVYFVDKVGSFASLDRKTWSKVGVDKIPFSKYDVDDLLNAARSIEKIVEETTKKGK